MHYGRARHIGLVALGLGVAVLAAACSSGSSGGSQPSAPNGSGGITATGSPITVGFVNSDTGGFAVPEATTTAKAAAEYVNSHGGIHGHVLKLDTCSTDGTPGASTKCANQFVTDKVLAVLLGDDLGLDAAEPVYKKAGLHIFGVDATQAATSDPSNTIMIPPFTTIYHGLGSMFKDGGAHSIVYVLPNVGPVIKQVFGLLKASGERVGVQSSLTLVSPVNPDFTAAVNAAKAKHADLLYLAFQENDCTNAVRTARTLGWTGKIFAGACTQFVKKLGPQATGVYTAQYVFPYAARESAGVYDSQLTGEFAIYKDALEAADENDLLESGYGVYGFSTVMTFANIVKGMNGEVTQTTINTALASFKGHEFLGTPQDCTAKILPGGACGRYYIQLQVQADGTQTLVNGKPFDLASVK